MKIALTGSSGFLGRALTRELETDGHEVIRIVRREQRAPNEIVWHPERGAIDSRGLHGVDGAVHLAGESLAGLWTRSKKHRILESRVATTALLARALADVSPRPAVLLSASAAGYYGQRGSDPLTEAEPPGDDFLAQLCRAWEAAAIPAADAGIRVVHLRFGLIFDRRSQALTALLPFFRLGLGATFGGGHGYWSWISLVDALAAVQHALATQTLAGGVNVAAPESVTQRTFARTLGRVLHRPVLFNVPAVLLRAAAGEMAEQVLLSSTRLVPSKLIASGFEFRYPQLEPALRAMLHEDG